MRKMMIKKYKEWENTLTLEKNSPYLLEMDIEDCRADETDARDYGTVKRGKSDGMGRKNE